MHLRLYSTHVSIEDNLTYRKYSKVVEGIKEGIKGMELGKTQKGFSVPCHLCTSMSKAKN